MAKSMCILDSVLSLFRGSVIADSLSCRFFTLLQFHLTILWGFLQSFFPLCRTRKEMSIILLLLFENINFKVIISLLNISRVCLFIGIKTPRGFLLLQTFPVCHVIMYGCFVFGLEMSLGDPSHVHAPLTKHSFRCTVYK